MMNSIGPAGGYSVPSRNHRQSDNEDRYRMIDNLKRWVKRGSASEKKCISAGDAIGGKSIDLKGHQLHAGSGGSDGIQGLTSSPDQDNGDEIRYYAVFDGHGGHQCSEYLSVHLHRLMASSSALTNLELGRVVSEGVELAEQRLLDQARQADPVLQKQHELELELRQSQVKLIRKMIVSDDNDQSHKATRASPSTDSNSAVADADRSAIMKRRVSDLLLPTDPPTESALLKSGSCAVVALHFGSDLWVGNVGDCRAVVSVGGKARAITKDHTASNPEEIRRVQEAGGLIKHKRVFGMLQVTRALGDPEFKIGPNVPRGTLIATPEVYHERLTDQHEFLILGCDGLWNVIDNQTAVDHVGKQLGMEKNSAQKAAETLVDLAIDRGSNDDITVIVIPFRPFMFDLSKVRKPIRFDLDDD